MSIATVPRPLVGALLAIVVAATAACSSFAPPVPASTGVTADSASSATSAVRTSATRISNSSAAAPPSTIQRPTSTAPLLSTRPAPPTAPSTGPVPSTSASAGSPGVAPTWPSRGQAAYRVGSGPVNSSPGQHPVPIASVAKVMTAYLVLRHHPLPGTSDGFRITVTEADVQDTRARLRDDESIVDVRAGEVLTERQALTALLLPSANNVAILLAREDAGSTTAFVAEMNQQSRVLGMAHTSYTDPSGLDPGTVSTAGDQVLLAAAAMRDPTFAAIVASRVGHIPVAGTVRNTDTLLGVRGFVGIKTGSDDAAGGCFMFRTRRMVRGGLVEITGVVLGQHETGQSILAAGLRAGDRLAQSLSR